MHVSAPTVELDDIPAFVRQDPSWVRKSMQAGMVALVPVVGVCFVLGWWERAAVGYRAGDTRAPEPLDDVARDVRRGALAFRWMCRGWVYMWLAIVMSPALGVYTYRLLWTDAALTSDADVLALVAVSLSMIAMTVLLVVGAGRAFAASVAWLRHGPSPEFNSTREIVRRHVSMQANPTKAAIMQPFTIIVRCTVLASVTSAMALGAAGAEVWEGFAFVWLPSVLLLPFGSGFAALVLAASCSAWLRRDPDAAGVTSGKDGGF